MSIFQGLSAFPITPLDEQGRVDTYSLANVMEPLVDSGMHSIGLLGSTGSYAYLAEGQRRSAIETAIKVIDGHVPIIVGVGALTTDDTLAYSRTAIELGADGLLLAPVSYIPLLDDEVAWHFETIASAVSRPVCIYNNPSATHFEFSLDLIRRLAAHPNIQAIKYPAKSREDVADQHAALENAVGDGLEVGYSVDANACEALLAGGQAWYSVMAGVFPAACVDIVESIQAGDAATARAANQRLQPLWDMCVKYSSYRVAHDAASIIGLANSVMPRPILPLSDEAQAELRAVLNQCELV